MFLLLALILINRPCRAIDYNADELLSLIRLTPESATQGSVTALLGKPLRVEENKKRTLWYYTHGNTEVVISWNSRSASFEKFSFTHKETAKSILDDRLPQQLKSGTTDITQALKLLGTPKDITVKEKTQEMHYAYQEKVLRLFFRDRVLVDYCLY